MMRSIEIHRLSSSADDLSKRRHSFSADTLLSKFTQPDGHRFRRNFQKRRRSAEIEKIVAKYSSKRRSASPHVVHSPDDANKSFNTSLKIQKSDSVNSFIKPSPSTFLPDVCEIPEILENIDHECSANRIDTQNDLSEKTDRSRKSRIQSSKSYLNISLSTVLQKENYSLSMDNLNKKSPDKEISEKLDCNKRNVFLSASSLEMRHLSDESKLKSVNFKEESILRRSASVDTLDNGNLSSNMFYARRKGSNNSELKWWQLKYRPSIFDCWIKWRRRRVGTYDGR